MARSGRPCAGTGRSRSPAGAIRGRRVSVPTTMLWSDQDTALSRWSVRKNDKYVDAPYEFVTLEGVSHWIPTEAPEACADGDPGADRGRRSVSHERPPAPERLPHPVVDNHCHLDISRGGDPVDVAGTIEAAAEVGVPRIVQIGCDLPGARWAVEAATTYDALVAGVALHPNEVPRLADEGRLEDALAEIEALAQAHDKVRAVGETGLDHFRTGEEGRAAQVRVVPVAHRPRQAAGQDAGDPRPRCPRRGARDHRRRGRAGPLGDALLLRRRRLRPPLPRPRRLPLLRRHGHLQERPAAAQRAGRRAAGPAAGRDRRAVPCAPPVPRPHQRVVPRSRSPCS